jgi:GT2 family glycosyltransferase
MRWGEPKLDDPVASQSSSRHDLEAQLGVVLVAHKRADLALECIQTLPVLPRERIVVVINAPDLTNPRAVERLREHATVAFPDQRQGYGANLNLGVRLLPSSARYLLLANDDVRFAEGSVFKLLETLQDDSQVGIVGPAIRQLHGRQPPLQPQYPTRLAIALNMTVLPLGPAWDPLSRRAGLIPPEDPDERARNGWVIGAAMLARADAFAEVGGFDEDFFLYYEEIDFCYRLREAGWRVAWRADAPAEHEHAASTGGSHLSQIFFESERLYYRKRLGLVRLAFFEAGLVGIYVASWMYNLVLAAIRPSSAAHRFAMLRSRWSTRMFLRGRRRALF